MAEWQKGILSCFSDCGGCIYGLFCPCCAVASARQKFDESDWCFNCLCLNPCVARNIIREGYGIEGSCMGDICKGFLCGMCVPCHLVNETNARGTLKSSLGTNNQEWKKGLCGCFSLGCGPCLYAFFCPACAMASARTNYDTSHWCFNCLCVPGALSHNVIREGKNIRGNCIMDIIMATCCSPCAAARALNETRDGQVA